MMCLRHAMLYILLLPIPAASPVFLALFAITLLVTIKPCGYCLTLFTILFLSTSSHSPLYSNPVPSSITTDNPSGPSSSASSSGVTQSLQLLPIDAADPERSWLTLNHNNIFDPLLIAYRPRVEHNDPTPFQSINNSEQSIPVGVLHQLQQLGTIILEILPASIKPTSPNPIPVEKNVRPTPLPLPKGFLDMRWKGMGVVLDFGWKRSVEGLEWENEVQDRKWPEERNRVVDERDVTVRDDARGSLAKDW